MTHAEPNRALCMEMSGHSSEAFQLYCTLPAARRLHISRRVNAGLARESTNSNTSPESSIVGFFSLVASCVCSSTAFLKRDIRYSQFLQRWTLSMSSLIGIFSQIGRSCIQKLISFSSPDNSANFWFYQSSH